jgi:hypothetical protein
MDKWKRMFEAMYPKIDPEQRVEAVECRDTENGDDVLIDTLTNKILIRWPRD